MGLLSLWVNEGVWRLWGLGAHTFPLWACQIHCENEAPAKRVPSLAAERVRPRAAGPMPGPPPASTPVCQSARPALFNPRLTPLVWASALTLSHICGLECLWGGLGCPSLGPVDAAASHMGAPSSWENAVHCLSVWRDGGGQKERGWEGRWVVRGKDKTLAKGLTVTRRLVATLVMAVVVLVVLIALVVVILVVIAVSARDGGDGGRWLC